MSYLSIALVIALGLCGFLTNIFVGAGMDEKAREYFTERSFKNFEMTSSLGVDEEDILKVSELEGVGSVEGVIRGDGKIRIVENSNGESSDEPIGVQIISITEDISVPELTEGEAPIKANECMVGEDFAEISGISVGDKVELSFDGFDEGDPLPEETFTVTALMHHSDYLRRGQTKVVAVPLAAFNQDITRGNFTAMFIKNAEDSKGRIFDVERFEEEAPIKNALEALAPDLEEKKEKRLEEEAQKEINEAWAEAEKKFAEAEAEINKGEETLNTELENARAELAAAERELNNRVAEGERKLRSAEETLNEEVKSAQKQVDEAEEKLEKYKSAVETFDVVFGDDLISKLKKFISDSQRVLDSGTKDEEVELAKVVIENEDVIRLVVFLVATPDATRAANDISNDLGIDCMSTLSRVKNFDAEGLIRDAHICADTENPSKEDLKRFKKSATEFLDITKELVDLIERVKAAVDEAERELAEAKALLASKEEEGRNEINAGWNELNRQKANGEAQIREGWALYEENKTKGESEIAEAREKLAKEKVKAEEEVQKARDELEIPECRFLVLDRNANAGFVDVKGNSDAMRNGAWAYGLLFVTISAVVCFSTLVIIIEEQKKMVGTVKAFGFFKNEVLGKYLVFGVSAAVLGCMLGIPAALGESAAVQSQYTKAGIYQFGQARSIIVPSFTIAACVGMILICAIATVVACSEILKSPASILMKGAKINDGSSKKKSVSGKGGSLYSRLIVRNMLDDKARVIVSILIIAFSCVLVGVGFSLKFAYDGMSVKQASDVLKYDIKIDYPDNIEEDVVAKLDKALADSGVDYMPAVQRTQLYRWDNNLNGLIVLAGDPERLNEFYGVSKTGTTTPIEIPSDGVLVQNKMRETYGMKKGTVIQIMNTDLELKDVPVVGEFQNYVGRTVVVSSEGYKNIFGDYKENCFFVKLNGADAVELENKLSAITDRITIEHSKDFSERFKSVSSLYNVVIVVTTGVAILMSVMILTNLANIFLNRKKTELIVMRVNGFSVKKTRDYLAKEAILTTAIGVSLGVVIGAIAAPIVTRMLEQPELQFVRTFNPKAWIIAVILEASFALIINLLVFNKVKKLNLRDIA